MTSAGSPKDAGTPSSKRSHPKSPASSAGHHEDHAISGASAFRNVSACNRCRVRKNRCDQKLPACSSCEKAGTKCVSYDHITKKEVPRSYVYYLETRNEYLEALLRDNGISFTDAEEFVYVKSTHTDVKHASKRSVAEPITVPKNDNAASGRGSALAQDQDKLDKLVSSASDVAVKGTSDSRYLGATSGISFARVVFAAVKSSLPPGSDKGRGSNSTETRSSARNGTRSNSDPTMHDSFFGLHTKPTISPAPFPSRELALRLADLYFEHANPQLPILHRTEFMTMFEDIYTTPGRIMMPKETFFLNIVFAIGAAIIVGKPASLEDAASAENHGDLDPQPPSKRRRIAEEQKPPEEYHASAIVHLESVLNGSGSTSPIGDDLEGLQAVLLLASFALLRPIPPGLWYIIGVAVRLAVDLGLHADDALVGKGAGSGGMSPVFDSKKSKQSQHADRMATDQGKRQYISDYRRRLWWCTYSLDRLVSSVVGRPFGISDRFVTTQFPSILDDKFITQTGLNSLPESVDAPSHKYVAYHYFRYRLLQSEILQVLQFRQTQLAREKGIQQENPYLLTDMPCPFLKGFDGSFRRWRNDMDSRLLAWRESAPTPAQTGVDFSPLFLELNYWHGVLMLYRQSLSVPTDLAQDLNTTETVSSPLMLNIEDNEDADIVFLKVAAAGQKVLKIYRLLHRKYLVNYTYLSTHHLFMAGISFLYAIWHSPLVRSQLTLDDVDFTALAGTSVLEDLVVFCPPARACHDAFSRMTKATIKMCLATTGFGKKTRLDSADKAIDPHLHSLTVNPPSMESASPQDSAPDTSLDPNNPNFAYAPVAAESKSNVSMFDTDLRNLFSSEESGKTFSSQMIVTPQSQMGMQRPVQYATPQPFHPDVSMAAMALESPSRANFSTAAAPYQQYPQYAQQPQQQQPQTPSQWNELDFLNSVPAMDTYGMNMGASSIDSLGLGFGWDGNIPGTGADDNKTSFDMFDGFFFGGGGVGTGYEGNNDNMDMSGPQ